MGIDAVFKEPLYIILINFISSLVLIFSKFEALWLSADISHSSVALYRRGYEVIDAFPTKPIHRDFSALASLVLICTTLRLWTLNVKS
jgi:hypothetical protein